MATYQSTLFSRPGQSGPEFHQEVWTSVFGRLLLGFFIFYLHYPFFFLSSQFQLLLCFFLMHLRCLSGYSSALPRRSWNQKSLGYGGEELFSSIVQPLLPGLYPLEKCGLLDLAAWHVQLMWAGLASAAFIVFNAASICFLSKPLPTNY